MAENVSYYLIFTKNEIYDEDCKEDIFYSLVQAFEKIYTSDIVRLKAGKMKKSKIVNTLKLAKEYAKRASYLALDDFNELYENDQPKVMSLASSKEEHEWNWVIELRLDMSKESSRCVTFDTNLPDDVGFQ